jgi:N-methylhydantoinase B/oxoprolinase/acetone carboxylase alpha subunit
MLKLIFDINADPLKKEINQASSVRTEGHGVEHLTLEFNSNPFRQFIKELETLMETDPAEAVRLIDLALNDKVFDTKAQVGTLSNKREEILEILEKPELDEQPSLPQHIISHAPNLQHMSI